MKFSGNYNYSGNFVFQVWKNYKYKKIKIKTAIFYV